MVPSGGHPGCYNANLIIVVVAVTWPIVLRCSSTGGSASRDGCDSAFCRAIFLIISLKQLFLKESIIRWLAVVVQYAHPNTFQCLHNWAKEPHLAIPGKELFCCGTCPVGHHFSPPPPLAPIWLTVYSTKSLKKIFFVIKPGDFMDCAKWYSCS